MEERANDSNKKRKVVKRQPRNSRRRSASFRLKLKYTKRASLPDASAGAKRPHGSAVEFARELQAALRDAENAANLATMLRGVRRLREFTGGDEATVYLSSNDSHDVDRICAALRELGEAVGFELEMQGEPIIGSWFAKFRLTFGTKVKLQEVAHKLEKAAELHYIDAPRSQNDERESNAVANLVKSLESIDNAVIRLSSILLIKSNGTVVAHVLTDSQIELLVDNPALLQSPQAILGAFSSPKTPTRKAATYRNPSPIQSVAEDS